MKILFDETVDQRFQKKLTFLHKEHTFMSATILGWAADCEAMRGLSAIQKDKLLLLLAKRKGFWLFITADVHFFVGDEKVLPVAVLLLDAQENAPSYAFLESVSDKIGDRIEAGKGRKIRLYRVQNPKFEPPTTMPKKGMLNLDGTKFKPIANLAR